MCQAIFFIILATA